jgi:hypothetical protein
MHPRGAVVGKPTVDQPDLGEQLFIDRRPSAERLALPPGPVIEAGGRYAQQSTESAD